MPQIDRCPACGGAELEPFHSEPSVPANSCLLLSDRQEARSYPRGALELAFCARCGFIANTRFDPALAEYSERYEETQGYSARFMSFARDLATSWVERYGLAGKDVLEIGCGKGEFLTMMVEAGAGRGTGIDPGVHPERIDSPAGARLTWIADFYSDSYADLRADAVVCRHTLEHIQPVADFLSMIRRNLADQPDTVVLFELPDVRRVLEEVAFWDFYYEHCSYFSLGSLVRLFRRCGFHVLDASLAYDGQYLLVEARPADQATAQPAIPGEDDLEELAKGVETFARAYEDKKAAWRAEVNRVTDGGGRVVIWGAGSKGVAYLSGLGITDEVAYAVDINPHKHGMFMAGTGQEIVAPEFLRSYQPDLVVAMNPIYLGEIREELDQLGVSPELVAV